MLTVPAAVVPTVQKGVLIEFEYASSTITALCESLDETPRSEYEEQYARFDEARELLECLGYVTPDPPVEIEVDLAAHRPMLLRVLREQQRADIELMDDMDSAGRLAAGHRVEMLQELIDACGGKN